MSMVFVGTIVQYEREPIRSTNIMPSGSITLEQVAARTAALAVACTRCDRAGRYNLGALIAGRTQVWHSSVAVGRLPEAEFDQRV